MYNISFTEDTCDWVPSDGWYFDTKTDYCSTNFQGSNCDGVHFYEDKMACTRQNPGLSIIFCLDARECIKIELQVKLVLKKFEVWLQGIVLKLS